MDNTIIQQGRFVQTNPAAAVTLQLRSDLDWMTVYNYTQIAANAAATGYKFYWQRGMVNAAGNTTGIEYRSNAGATAVDMTALAAGGFTLINSVEYATPARRPAGGALAVTNANPPVITDAASDLAVGEVVKFTSLNAQPQINGLDFTVTASTPGANFTIGNINLVNSVASATGFWRRVPFNPAYYPVRRYITFISSSATAGRAKVYMSVTHQFTVGQKVRLQLPGSVWGAYTQLNNVECTIVAVNEARAPAEPNNGGVDNNIVVDVDVSGLGAWGVFGAGNQSYPAATTYPFTPAQVVPVGENTAQAIISGVDILDDSTINTGYIGVLLGAGANGPAGQANDVIYWVAGKSFSV